MRHIIHTIKNFKIQRVYYFDLVVVLIVLSTIGVFLYKRFVQKTVWVDVRIMISDGELWYGGELPQYWLLDELQIGEIAYNSFGDEIAKIENIEIFSVGGTSKQAYIDLKLKVSYDAKKQVYLYNFQPIQKGKAIDFNFGKNLINGLFVSIGDEQGRRLTKRIQVRAQHLELWLAQSYQVGMTMKDSKGRVLAEIKDIEIQRSQFKPINFIDGQMFTSTREYYDVYFEIELSVIEDDEDYYRFINGTNIKVSSEIWFQFSEIEAMPTKILKIIE